MRSKYAYLLEDKDVRRWFDNLAAKSIITAAVYLRTLGYFCELNKTDPKELLKVAKTKDFRDKFIDFVRELERNGKAGSYIARVSIALMAFSGLRPQILGNYTGTDGIRLKDFVEAEIKSDGIEFKKVPAMLVIRKGLSKTRHKYFTFVPEQTITYIKEYLDKRIKQGEKLSKESPLLGFDPGGRRKNRFLRTNLVRRDVKEAILKAGFSWRPYVLRAFTAILT